ncbi:MAG: DUF3800 domain-containing protein [Verrucomicrobia bacterium]|nr:DUF3800 domain-containing protein [Verrucomicrobiota bacterium]
MSQTYNIYCDESCHLQRDQHKVMVLGAIWCPLEKTREIAVRVREKKIAHGLPPEFEIKWTKVSPAKLAFYQDVLDYFFDDDDLHFRSWVIADKTQLQHAKFNQDHDTWYYKMMFGLLEPLLSPKSCYRIYLDQKDTRSAAKVRHLQEVLSNNLYDFDRKIIEWVQVIRSHDVEQMQLADLLIGAIGYANRGLNQNAAKNALVARMRERSGYTLTRKTLLRESKVNVFIWQPQEGTA